MTAFIENNMPPLSIWLSKALFTIGDSTKTWKRYRKSYKKCSGEVAISIFADYSKALDTIDLKILLHKMHKPIYKFFKMDT